jgi:hypothetical protein
MSRTGPSFILSVTVCLAWNDSDSPQNLDFLIKESVINKYNMLDIWRW